MCGQQDVISTIIYIKNRETKSHRCQAYDNRQRLTKYDQNEKAAGTAKKRSSSELGNFKKNHRVHQNRIKKQIFF